MNHTPTKKEIVIAFSLVAALAVLCGLIALAVAATRPGRSAVAEREEDRQKWSIIVSPDLPPGPGGIDATLTDALLSVETRYSQGKPRVDGRTIYYRDWNDGKDRIWNVGASDIKIEPQKAYKDR